MQVHGASRVVGCGWWLAGVERSAARRHIRPACAIIPRQLVDAALRLRSDAFHTRISQVQFFIVIKHTLSYCSSLLSNRHHRSSGDCLERKKENCQVCSVQYCVQQLCTVQYTHIWTDLTVVCWLDYYCVWLYCWLQFICARFSLLWSFCVVVYLCMCGFVVDLVSSVLCRDWLGRTSPKWPIFCRVGYKKKLSTQYAVIVNCLSFIGQQ